MKDTFSVSLHLCCRLISRFRYHLYSAHGAISFVKILFLFDVRADYIFISFNSARFTSQLAFQITIEFFPKVTLDSQF